MLRDSIGHTPRMFTPLTFGVLLHRFNEMVPMLFLSRRHSLEGIFHSFFCYFSRVNMFQMLGITNRSSTVHLLDWENSVTS